MSHQEFENEIRNIFLPGKSFYAYRQPEDTKIIFGTSVEIAIGLEIPGFVIGSFDPSKPFLTIPFNSFQSKKKPEITSCVRSFPRASTSFDEYTGEICRIISDIKSGIVDKVVGARVIIRELHNFDIAEKFNDLCLRHPRAFVFCYSTPVTGCWIGASPELLLSGKNGILESMALAGTRPAGSLSDWDDKNLEEQQIVTDYIIRVLENHRLRPRCGKTYSRQAGNIEHICTPISAYANSLTLSGLDKLLHELSPTPALCGYPKDKALEIIKATEKFDRGGYGGFCGPFHSVEDFSFHVALRCAELSENKIAIYAGGGITAKSNVGKEWAETEMKASNI